jgi:uncharacterized protein YjlB
MEEKIPQSHRQAEYILLKDDCRFPNNDLLPLLLYRETIARGGPLATEDLFSRNRWVNTWRNGIYTRHHYHSTAHEVLGVYRGSAIVQFGGEDGFVYEVRIGDVIVIPAGVAHKCLKRTASFKVVGAYPEGQMWDMCYGADGERPETDENIARVPVPQCDPVYGMNGPLIDLWSKNKRPAAE